MTYAMSEVRTKGARSLWWEESDGGEGGVTTRYEKPLSNILHSHSEPHPPLEAAEHLGVAQELPEVDVEHVTRRTQHDVVVVPVADAQDVGGHAAASARVDEVLRGLEEEVEGEENQEEVEEDEENPERMVGEEELHGLPGCQVSARLA